MYVIYKENKLPGVGGIHPQGIETGLAYYKGWNLAKCPDEKVHFYKEFDFVAVTPQIVKGIQILDSMLIEEAELEALNMGDNIVGFMGAPVDSEITISLSDSDKENMRVAETFINNLELKMVTRAKVREMKDLEDDLVDLKRVIHSIITFVVENLETLLPVTLFTYKTGFNFKLSLTFSFIVSLVLKIKMFIIKQLATSTQYP